MKKNFLIICVFIFIIYIGAEFSIYNISQKSLINEIKYCETNNSVKCFDRMFELLIPKLLIYKAKENKEQIKYFKANYAQVWFPFFAYMHSSNFIHFYDSSINTGLDNYLYDKDLSTSFKLIRYKLQYNTESEKNTQIQSLMKLLEEMQKNDQKTILKIEIYDLDQALFENLLKFKDIINGYIIYLKLDSSKKIINSISILDKINRDYILVARNTDLTATSPCFFEYKNTYTVNFKVKSRYYKGSLSNSLLILSYVKKDLLDSYKISLIQNTDKIYSGNNVLLYRPLCQTPKSDISYVVTISEIIKQKLKNE